MDWSDYLDAHQARFVDELVDFVRIPSVSAAPAHIPDVVAAGEWVVRRLQAAGMENVRLMPTDGHPVVYGDWLHAPSKPTIPSTAISMCNQPSPSTFGKPRPSNRKCATTRSGAGALRTTRGAC